METWLARKTVSAKLALNSDTLCYCLGIAGVKGVHHYTGLSQKLERINLPKLAAH